jgi:hypothetical protein
MEYEGTYQDRFGTAKIKVLNDFKEISFRLGEFNFFCGNSFDDFELSNHDKFSKESLERFTFKTWNVYQSERKIFTLKNFILYFSVPVTLLNFKKEYISMSLLHIKIDIQENEWENTISLTISHNDNEYSGKSDLFEVAAWQINKQVEGKFIIKSCFWCLYSDYGVAGQGMTGLLQCFLTYKDKYLKVKRKDQYMKLPIGTPVVQEIYSCDSFEPRKKGIGYRGWE